MAKQTAAKKLRVPQLNYTTELLSQIPTGHVIGPTRMALLLSPCCERRVRAPLIHEKRGWQLLWKWRKCPRCRFLWRLTARITKNGYISRARFAASGKHEVVQRKRAKKQPK